MKSLGRAAQGLLNLGQDWADPVRKLLLFNLALEPYLVLFLLRLGNSRASRRINNPTGTMVTNSEGQSFTQEQCWLREPYRLVLWYQRVLSLDLD